MDNSQTRALSGDLSTPFGACSERMLEEAKRNLEEHFAVVGLTERFDETLVLLHRTFGWSRLHYVRVNVAPRRAADAPVPQGALELMREQNWLDRQLYEWAARRFGDLVNHDALMLRDLRRLKLANRLYRPWGTGHIPIPTPPVSSGGATLGLGATRDPQYD